MYRTLRSAYLERAHKLPEATIYYRVKRYDFHESLTEGLDVVQAGPVKVARLLSTSRVTALEVNEPLMLSSVVWSASAIATLRLRSLFGAPRVSVVSYALENRSPLDQRPVQLKGRIRHRVTSSLARFVWRNVDRMAFATDASRATYRDVLPHPSKRTETTVIPALPAPCDCKHEADRDTPRLIFVGALVERKGLLLLLKAWPAIRDRVPGARLAVVGKGKFEELALEAAQLDDSIDVFIDPDRSEIHRLLRRSAVLALPSQPTALWREQVGLPIVEGLAHGCTIVTTEQTGLAGWLSEHGHAVIGTGTDPRALADAAVSALTAARSAASVLADLPAVDGRLAADAWMFQDAPADTD